MSSVKTDYNTAKQKAAQEEHDRSGRVCPGCGKSLPYAKRKQMHCDMQCAGVARGLRPKKVKQCEHCQSVMNSANNQFCSSRCKTDAHRKLYLEKWLEGLESGHFTKNISRRIRRYMIDQAGGKCTQCGWAEVNPKTGKVPLTIDHIDGNSQNSSKNNLRVLCPNCHSLTPTYGALNMGRGRRHRRKQDELEVRTPNKYLCVGCGETFNSKFPKKYCTRACNHVSVTKKDWPSNEDLHSLVWSKPMREAAKDIGVSDTALRKRCIAVGVSRPRQGYWISK